MGNLCASPVDPELQQEQAKSKAIEKGIAAQDRAEAKVQKLLLLGAGESGKSTIFKQIKVLYQKGFSDDERKEWRHIIHVNVAHAIHVLLENRQHFADVDGSLYLLKPDTQIVANEVEAAVADESSEGFTLTPKLAGSILTLWKDPAIKATFLRSNEFQLPDCADFFLTHVIRIAQPDYLPTQDDVLYARVRTTGVVETEFSTGGKMKDTYRLFDVGGQRNERRKWIHLFDNVTAVIFCIALSEYDQMLAEDESENRLVEAKNLFEEMLKQRWFQQTSFLLFLNKYDLFEQKIPRVPLSKCEWCSDYKGTGGSAAEQVDHAYKYLKEKFYQIFVANTAPKDLNTKRVIHIYKTTAINTENVRGIFQLVERVMLMKALDSSGIM